MLNRTAVEFWRAQILEIIFVLLHWALLEHMLITDLCAAVKLQLPKSDKKPQHELMRNS